MSGLIDFHCHVDLYADQERVIREAEAAGVFTLAVTTTPLAWPRNYELTKDTTYVRAALGLHPQLVADREKEIDLWDKYLPLTRYVGEVGLDAGPRFYKSLDAQKRVFQHVLKQCARAGDKILTVHSIRSATAVLDHIEEYFSPERGKIVLHWFTGSKSEARRALELGCYFSINNEMMANSKHHALVSGLPINRILTETDGPFTSIDNRPSKPSDVDLVVRALATMHKSTYEEMVKEVRGNLRALLK